MKNYIDYGRLLSDAMVWKYGIFLSFAVFVGVGDILLTFSRKFSQILSILSQILSILSQILRILSQILTIVINSHNFALNSHNFVSSSHNFISNSHNFLSKFHYLSQIFTISPQNFNSFAQKFPIPAHCIHNKRWNRELREQKQSQQTCCVIYGICFIKKHKLN